MSRTRCVILDDELSSLSYLKLLCEQLPFVEVVRCFDSSENFLAGSDSLEFDACLLDINMPSVNGLEVARRFKGKYIIFVSAHPEFAADAFDLEAIDFIRKPVSAVRLERALTKATKLLSGSHIKSSFTWNTSFGRTIIFFDEIAWISTSDIDKRDKSIHFSDGRTLLLKNITLDKLISILPADAFMQINKSEIISRPAVQAHSSAEVILRTENSASLALGESYRRAFLSWIG